MRFTGILESIGNTPIVELKHLSPKPGVRLFAKLEGQNPSGSVKDRIAWNMISEAEARGDLTPGRIVVEPTSGNTGIGLAMVCRLKGYKLVAVMPENYSGERIRLLKAFGAEVVLSDGAERTNGSVKVAKEILATDARYYMPDQYSNPANPAAHFKSTGPEILRDLPEIDVFVAGLGTGGTITGTGRFLKQNKKDVRVVAAIPFPGQTVMGLRSLTEGFQPEVFDESILDGRVFVNPPAALASARLLADRESIFAGISGGAAIRAGLEAASRMSSGNVLILLPDGGWKYLSTELWNGDLPTGPDAETVEVELH